MTDSRIEFEDTYTALEIYQAAGCDFPFTMKSWAHPYYDRLSVITIKGWYGKDGYTREVFFDDEPEEGKPLAFAGERQGDPNILRVDPVDVKGWLPGDWEPLRL
ncbi:hypothetical protein BGP77_16615 [Saccharospirillum sp. MSK14-1]|uniref:hypothetical protein n=1 Tax=Saccharospirillum sp. MSK14-1 TaxID=1897632 RepID=UPI000D390DB9|nr:hypothetical protein [Saccharospirillum sp. MSK14-1]PTY38074.1 hypothetical protein BGP77_16615 [Saccharospirillum sp. MSK14-1]